MPALAASGVHCRIKRGNLRGMRRPPTPPSRAGLPSRRQLLRAACSACVLGAAFGGGILGGAVPAAKAEEARGPLPFKLSLSQRSLHQEFTVSRRDPLDFARVASGLGADAVEYEGSLYASKLADRRHLAELKRRAAGEGIWSKLILIDGDGQLGAPQEKARRRAAKNHERWLEAAAFLGCHAVSLQVSAGGNEDDQLNWLSDGLRRLARLGDPYGIDILVENRAGFSAKASWLVELLNAVGHPRCGTRPNFASFQGADGSKDARYQGVRELMPFARAVSANAQDFDDRGEEAHTNYAQMLKIVTDAGYHGHVAIEYEGKRLSEQSGIARTKELLERARTRIAQSRT
jgi:L-ribulose-5-phosphate 3-epimerase